MTKYVASPRRDDLIIIDHLLLIDPERKPITEKQEELIKNFNYGEFATIRKDGKEKTDR